jgi:hypothetical protein
VGAKKSPVFVKSRLYVTTSIKVHCFLGTMAVPAYPERRVAFLYLPERRKQMFT